MKEERSSQVYLIPSLLGDTSPEKVLPAYTLECIRSLRYFLVETAREGRRFLSKVGMPLPIQELWVEEMPKSAADPRWKSLFAPLDRGEAIGVISDAGCPGIADPGRWVVHYAHEQGKIVEPLVGPSSFTLALMAAGFNGQAFAFHGYLPIDKGERKKAIIRMENEALQRKVTQMFMETPYRNQALLQTMVNVCKPDTRLCIAANLTCPDAMVRTQSIKAWKAELPAIHKIPAVFLLFGD